MLPVLFYNWGEKKKRDLFQVGSQSGARTRALGNGVGWCTTAQWRARYCSWQAAQAPSGHVAEPHHAPSCCHLGTGKAKKDPEAVTTLEEQEIFRFNV